MNHVIPGLIELIAKVGPYALAFGVVCGCIWVLLSALQYTGEPLTKNEPFGWVTKYPKFGKDEE
jgi:hypothetical protein